MIGRINIVGCGSLGSVLGRLWWRAGVLEIGDILNRSLESGAKAAAFIGGGRAIKEITEMQPAEFCLIGTPDDIIAWSDRLLAAGGVLRQGDVVFHCSGALPASVLAVSAAAGAWVASVHPVRSFADPDRAAAGFAGTFCGIEGEAAGVERLGPLFTAIGGQLLPIDPAAKRIYHSGGVFVCNYLAALMELGVRAYERAGVDRETALRVMEPIVRGTVDNIFSGGTAHALTGPIARGDAAAVGAQLAEIEAWDPAAGQLYRALGRIALELARTKGGAPSDALEAIAEWLEEGRARDGKEKV